MRIGHLSYWCPTRVGIPLVLETWTHHQIGVSVLHIGDFQDRDHEKRHTVVQSMMASG